MTDSHDLPEDASLAAHPLTVQRLAKLEAIRASGQEPYPVRFDRTATASALLAEYSDLVPATETENQAAVAGRIVAMRSFGNLIFPVIQDYTGRLQLFIDRRTLGDDAFGEFSNLDIGDWIGAQGSVITTKKGELSIRAQSFALLAKGLRPLPDKWHGLQDIERRYRQRYLDLIVSEDARRVAHTRSIIMTELRRQFIDRSFMEVETPVLQGQAGGALARPFVTHHNALGVDMYLRIATELHLKQLVIGGFERVFELGRVFRNEGVDSTHNPEFTTLEAYQALADYEDMMVLMEEVISGVARAAAGSTVIEYAGREIDLTPPYRRATMLQLLAETLGREVVLADRDAVVKLAETHGIDRTLGSGKIVTELYEALVESTLWDPTFVMDYPKETSPLAKVHRSDPDLTERFELFVGGMEIVNAFSELNDPADQLERFEQQKAARAAGDDEAHPVDHAYVRALEYGLPPTGGLGIGVDRLVMLLTNCQSIREVILFPHLRPE